MFVLFKGATPYTYVWGEVYSSPCLSSYEDIFANLCFSFPHDFINHYPKEHQTCTQIINSVVGPYFLVSHLRHQHFTSMGWKCMIATYDKHVAKGSKQCIFMVVGQPHQDKAVKMAGSKPPRYVSQYETSIINPTIILFLKFSSNIKSYIGY